MLTIKRILVPVDFSKPSLAALRYATALAKARRARLEVLHVVEAATYVPTLGAPIDLGELREAQTRAAHDRLDKLARDLRRRRLRCRTVLKLGLAATAIADYAKKNATDLIVMATHGRGFVRHLLLGNVAERVVRTAVCPVLTIRAGTRASAAKLRRIVAATDFSQTSQRALEDAAALARSSRAEMVVLHAVEPIALAGDLYGFSASAAMDDAVERAARELMAGVVSRLRKKRGLRCRGVLANGTAASMIVGAAKQLRADLVVVGTHGHGGLDRFLLGSVAERVVRTSSKPVLTVREPQTAARR